MRWRAACWAIGVFCLLVSTACVPGLGPMPVGPEVVTVDLLDGDGPFAVEAYTVEANEDFAGGLLTVPTEVGRPAGYMVAVPGHTVGPEWISWLGPRLASHGFAVLVIDTFDRSADLNEERADQAIAARQWMATQVEDEASPLFNAIDPERYSYAGHSMGGGGALLAAQLDPGTLSVLVLAGFSFEPDFPDLATPALVVACEADEIAPAEDHTDRYVATLAGPKVFLEAPGDHDCPRTGRESTRIIGRYAVAMLKHTLDEDQRYTPFLCSGVDSDPTADPNAPGRPALGDDPDILDFRSDVCS